MNFRRARAACAFFAANVYLERKAWRDAEITPAEYGGLLILRDMYSAADYEDRVLPLVREAFVDGKVTRERMQKLDGKLNDLGLRVFERLTRQDTKSRVSRAWDDARDSAADLCIHGKIGEVFRQAREQESRRP